MVLSLDKISKDVFVVIQKYLDFNININEIILSSIFIRSWLIMYETSSKPGGSFEP